ncbi:23S rRNA pseudouridine(1911/1915/1917) synthase RluD [Solimonas marina]|uniref:Pseudouridine synthase n=1 Tax=Solimonas marina TaxID=2714601 RepID=A0A970B5C3_9GAMM|nr:23S rRNA pseudouridine(1911/1915/1917) synthase RluD [Solimonas marina]NKF21395.1 23S rRNA pseudouridine(1911/1915/1917) synthase RluD [Solimonas marina]
MSTASPDDEDLRLQAEVPENLDGARLDVACARLFDQYSRARLQSWIESGRLLLNDAPQTRTRHPVTVGDRLELEAEPEQSTVVEPQDLPIEVVHQDKAIVIVNKPAGLTVHPGAGQRASTLQNALLYHFPQTAAVPRAGIIHRLDKDTSGLLVIALNLKAHHALVDELARREFTREYDALVQGEFIAGGTVDEPIGRHPRERLKMAVVDNGRPAVTHYRVQERFPQHTHLRVQLDTGRTHQIRVHLAHLRRPIVGDFLYGGPMRGSGLPVLLRDKLKAFPRQALHARTLEVTHPTTRKRVGATVEPPADIAELLELLRAHASGALK